MRRMWLLAAALILGCASNGNGAKGGSGGSNGSGGNGSGGAASGGTTSSGGNTGTGGVTASGAATSSGGTTSSGSTTGSGGMTSSGGTTGSGGVRGTGGTDGSGGAVGSGGIAASGGSGGAAGGVGGGTAGGPCGAAGLLFCDDFEKTAAGMPPPAPTWTMTLNPTTNGGTITVDGTTKAHSGSKSVHVASNGAFQTLLELKSAPTFPLPSGPVYLRVYMMLGAAMSGGHNTYFKSGPADPTNTNLETRVGVMASMLMINQPPSDRGVLSNKNYYTDNKPGVVFAPMTWNCVEVKLDPSASTIDVWVATKEVPDLHLTDWQQSPIGAFRFGFEQYAGPAGDFWYDDIAVGTMPIGCD